MKLLLKNNENGYTLVEMVVALALISLLLYFSTGILGNIALNSGSALKVKAINLAKNQMEGSLLQKKYEDFEQETENKKLLLKQTITKENTLIKIHIEIYDKKSKQVLYALMAYTKE